MKGVECRSRRKARNDDEISTSPRGLGILYRVIQKDGLSFVRLYFLNYTWYVNDLHNI